MLGPGSEKERVEGLNPEREIRFQGGRLPGADLLLAFAFEPLGFVQAVAVWLGKVVSHGRKDRASRKVRKGWEGRKPFLCLPFASFADFA